LQPLSKIGAFRKYLIHYLRYITVDTLSYKTISANKQTVTHAWHVIDGDGAIVGRAATHIATMLRGKHKPSYTPHVDTGDYVIVLNAEKMRFTGAKLDDKQYITYSGYQSGQKRKTAKQVFDSKPCMIIENAVRGMLPKNKLGRAMIKKLFVYEGDQHPHAAQKPTKFEL